MIHMYEETTGNIEHFEVSSKKMVADPRFNYSHNKGTVFYALTQNQLEQVIKSGRDLEDIAVLLDKRDFGRHGRPIDFLVWAEDMKTRVRFSKTD